MLPVAIIAGGLATRLGPLSDRVPKALLQVAGRPFIFHQLDLLKRQGIERVVLCVGHLGEQIEAAVGDGGAFGLTVRYSYDGATLLGTAGAIAQALPLLGERFFVMYGDTYLRCSLLEIQRAFEDSRSPALMTVLRNDDLWDRSNVLFRDGRLIDYDKRIGSSARTHIDFGLLVFCGSVFSEQAAGFADLADICRQLSLDGQLAGFEVPERFYEIGSPRGLLETQTFLSAGLQRA